MIVNLKSPSPQLFVFLQPIFMCFRYNIETFQVLTFTYIAYEANFRLKPKSTVFKLHFFVKSYKMYFRITFILENVWSKTKTSQRLISTS